MLKLFFYLLSIFLIVIIILRTPKDSRGLSSFATKNGMLGSPSYSERFLTIITALGILSYLNLAIKFNLANNF